MRRETVLAIAGWITAAVLATVLGVAAVNVLGAGITTDSVRPLSVDEAQRELAGTQQAEQEPPAEEPDPGPETEPPPQDAQTNPNSPTEDAEYSEVVERPSGLVQATCYGDQVALDWWTPANGWVVDDAEAGPGGEASVEFERGDLEEELDFTCHGDELNVDAEVDD